MKSRLMGSGFGMVVLACLAVVLAQTARAQAIPRTPDGKPDLSGTWVGGGRGGNVTGGVFAGQTRDGQSTMELTKWGPVTNSIGTGRQRPPMLRECIGGSMYESIKIRCITVIRPVWCGLVLLPTLSAPTPGEA